MWTGALALIRVLVLALRALGVLVEPVPGQALPAAWRAVLAVAGAGLCVALVAAWLAFFPPARYRRWVSGSVARGA